jgi:hypothetical protein
LSEVIELVRNPPDLTNQRGDRAQVGEGKKTVLHHSPLFSTLFEQLRVQNLVQSYLRDPILYFGSAMSFGEKPVAYGNLHQDSKGPPVSRTEDLINLFKIYERPYDPAKIAELYPIWRLFIYLSDHKNYSGGTKVKRGSHTKNLISKKQGRRALFKGKFRNIAPPFGYVNPECVPGDAILFNHRIWHSAHFLRLRKPFNKIPLPPFLDTIIKTWTFDSKLGRAFLKLIAQPFHPIRFAIVIDFCTESDWARGYQINRALNPMDISTRRGYLDCTDPNFSKRLNEVGLSLLENPRLKDVAKFLKN